MKMKKLLTILTLAAVLAAASGITGVMAESEIAVYVNEAQVEFDVPPRIIEDRTMIPFRYVANAFDAEVDYREEPDGRKIVTAVQGNKTLLLTIGDPNAVLIEDGAEKVLEFDVAPLIVPEGRTLVPIRLIGEAFGCSVGWNGDNREVVIIDPSAISEKIEAAAPELYNSLLTYDISKIKGVYDAVIKSGDVELGLKLTVDENALAVEMGYGEMMFNIIITPDAIYANEPSMTGDKWEITSLETIIDTDILQEAESIMDGNQIIAAIVDGYMEGIVPTRTTYSEISAVADALFAAAAEGFTITNDGEVSTATCTLTIPVENSQATLSISKATRGDVFEGFELKITDDTGAEDIISITSTGEAAHIEIPEEDDIISE